MSVPKVQKMLRNKTAMISACANGRMLAMMPLMIFLRSFNRPNARKTRRILRTRNCLADGAFLKQEASQREHHNTSIEDKPSVLKEWPKPETNDIKHQLNGENNGKYEIDQVKQPEQKVSWLWAHFCVHDGDSPT